MAPQLKPLARSDSKTKFFQRLGLSSENSSDNRLYELMKNEAILGRERILSSSNSLLPQLRDDPNASVLPPYSNVQICESAVHNEILRIYHEASPETKSKDMIQRASTKRTGSYDGYCGTYFDFVAVETNLDSPARETRILRWFMEQAAAMQAMGIGILSETRNRQHKAEARNG